MNDLEQLTSLVPHQYDHVIGVARGGLIPSVWLSHALGVPMSVMFYSSETGNGTAQSLGSFNLVGSTPILSSDKLLVVDDICDTGCTMLEVVNHLRNTSVTVDTACLHFRDQDVFTPTWYIHKILKSDPWVVYPWEETK